MPTIRREHGQPVPRLLIPLPDQDFDVTEVCLPWHRAVSAGIEVIFATPEGRMGECDPRLLTGVIFGQLGASRRAIQLYRQMQGDRAFRAPLTYASIEVSGFDALLLPGGHAKGVRQYLESTRLRAKVVEFMQAGKLVAAICHGPIVLARAGVLQGRRVTALLKLLEWVAWALTFWKLGDYYRTYPEYVEDEVRRAGARFVCGGAAPLVVEDRNLITARWPGDADRLARRLVERMQGG